jgi:CheY-like chemotaxis protein
LATVFGIVKQGGGAISVYSEVGHGSTFKVYFPCTDEPATPVAKASDGPRQRRGGVVLVAEDDAQLRKVIVTVLRRAGFSVLEAAGPIEALAIEEEYAGRIDLLLTDVVMPQMSGRQLAERLLARRPSLPVVYMSGYTDDRIGQHGVLDEGVNFLAKPVSPDGVVAMVERVLGEAR